MDKKVNQIRYVVYYFTPNSYDLKLVGGWRMTDVILHAYLGDFWINQLFTSEFWWWHPNIRAKQRCGWVRYLRGTSLVAGVGVLAIQFSIRAIMRTVRYRRVFSPDPLFLYTRPTQRGVRWSSGRTGTTNWIHILITLTHDDLLVTGLCGL